MRAPPEFCTIRPFRHPDRRGVIALWDRVFPAPAARNRPQRVLDAKLKLDDDLLLVAEHRMDGAVIGTVLGGYDGHRGWLYQVAVDPGYRRRGLGAALIEHAEAALRQAGCDKVNLQVRAGNEQVVAFYQRLGFVVEPRISMGKEID